MSKDLSLDYDRLYMFQMVLLSYLNIEYVTSFKMM